jgi:hypothetical protein
MSELYLHSPNTPPWRGAQLKHRDIFNFYRRESDPKTPIVHPRAKNPNIASDGNRTQVV